MLPKKVQKALAKQKFESQQITREKLQQAIARILSGETLVVKKEAELSPSSVAAEAGIDRTTLYRFHRPILNSIRKLSGKESRSPLLLAQSKAAASVNQVKELRALTEQAQQEVIALARINHRLDARVRELEELLRIRDETIAGYQAHSRKGVRSPDC